MTEALVGDAYEKIIGESKPTLNEKIKDDYSRRDEMITDN